jgi:lysophospholipase L1-like esterase
MKMGFLVCIVLLISCSKADNQIPAVSVDSTQIGIKDGLSWLALGDSYTVGEGVSARESFPIQTMDLLIAQGYKIATPSIIAATGWTTRNLQEAIELRKPALHDIVSLLIGVNDQFSRRDTTEYKERFENLLIKSIEIAHGKPTNVYVISIPDYSITPFANYLDTSLIRKETDVLNKMNKSISDAYGCNYLNITETNREAKFDRTLIAEDGLHPSGKEYARWAALLAKLIKQSIF